MNTTTITLSKSLSKFLCIIAMAWIPVFGYSQFSTHLDNSFGNSGTALGTLGKWDGIGVIKADTVNGGFFLYGVVKDQTCSVTPMRYYLTKYTDSGAPDISFNNGQPLLIVDFDCGLYVPTEASLTVQSDGKPVICGTVDYFSLGVKRFLTNGQPDTDFGNNGLVELGAMNAGTGIAQDNMGRIICTGFDLFGSSSVIVRLLNGGSIDTSFGTNGVVSFSQVGGVANLEQARIPYALSNGMILIGGYFENSTIDLGAYVLLLNDDGDIVTSFGNNGVFTTGAPYSEAIQAIMADEDNDRIYIALWSEWTAEWVDDPGESDFVLDCISISNGQYVNAFGTNGRTILNITPNNGSNRDILHGLALDEGGKIYGGGVTITANSTMNATVCRWNTNGTLDTHWLQGGTDVTAQNGRIHGMIMTDNGLVTAGFCLDPDDNTGAAEDRWDMFVARYGSEALNIDGTSAHQKQIQLYPNPTNGSLTLRLPADRSATGLKITDTTGRIIYINSLINATGSEIIDMSGYENGIYFVQVSFENGVQTVERVVKQ